MIEANIGAIRRSGSEVTLVFVTTEDCHLCVGQLFKELPNLS